jgi:hypothetical protein
MDRCTVPLALLALASCSSPRARLQKAVERLQKSRQPFLKGTGIGN